MARLFPRVHVPGLCHLYKAQIKILLSLIQRYLAYSSTQSMHINTTGHREQLQVPIAYVGAIGCSKNYKVPLASGLLSNMPGGTVRYVPIQLCRVELYDIRPGQGRSASVPDHVMVCYSQARLKSAFGYKGIAVIR